MTSMQLFAPASKGRKGRTRTATCMFVAIFVCYSGSVEIVREERRTNMPRPWLSMVDSVTNGSKRKTKMSGVRAAGGQADDPRKKYISHFTRTSAYLTQENRKQL